MTQKNNFKYWLCSSGLILVQMCELFPAEARTQVAKCSTGSYIMKKIPIPWLKDGSTCYKLLATSTGTKMPLEKPCWSTDGWRATRLFLKCSHDFTVLFFCLFGLALQPLVSTVNHFIPASQLNYPEKLSEVSRFLSWKCIPSPQNAILLRFSWHCIPECAATFNQHCYCRCALCVPILE